MSDWEDVQKELNSGSGGFFKPQQMAVGESVQITIVGYGKWTDTKYPIKDKQGKELGYTWRFRLADGRVWDVSNSNRKVIMAAMHPDGQEKPQPATFTVTNVGKVVDKRPSVKVAVVK